MQSERSPAVLLLNLPQASLAGIDLLSFTVSPRFRGIKDLSPGLHFIFTGASNAFSIRHGLWFDIRHSDDSQIFISKWREDLDALVAENDAAEHLRWRANIGEFWREGLAPYRQTSKDDEVTVDEWPSLISLVTPELLIRITASKQWALTSASALPIDRDDIPGIKREEFDAAGFEELHLLPIDLKRTWREGATGRERTDAAKDRSWALEQLILEHTTDADDVIGELQFCFIMVLTLNNWSCFEQWKRLLTLMLTCKAAVHKHADLFVRFIAVLRLQLQHVKDAEGGLIDMADEGGSLLKSILVRFRKGIQEDQTLDTQDVVDELDDLEAFLRDEYGWQFGGSFAKSGMLELEDGEHVQMDTTDFDEDDETGEYAPQVVDLSQEQLEALYPGEDVSLLMKLKASALHDPGTSTKHVTEVVDGASESSEEMGDLDELDERY